MCCKVSETTRSTSAIRMISSAESQNTSQEKFLPLNQDYQFVSCTIEACNILDDAIKREAIQDRFWQSISQQEIK